MIELTESSRRVRKALHAAFPKAKISVKSRSGDIEVQWDDSVTDVDGMNAALLKSGLAQSDEPAWNGMPRLHVDGHRIYLWCFNRAERGATKRRFEQSRAEEEARRQRSS